LCIISKAMLEIYFTPTCFDHSSNRYIKWNWQIVTSYD
jgi:hypothetical protein